MTIKKWPSLWIKGPLCGWWCPPYSRMHPLPTNKRWVGHSRSTWTISWNFSWMILPSLMTWPPICPNYDNVSRSVENMALAWTRTSVPSWFLKKMIFGFIVSKGTMGLDKKVEVLIKMSIPWNPHDIQVFNGLVQFYQCFVKKFVLIMASIIKVMHK